jgi:hypothetical protein
LKALGAEAASGRLRVRSDAFDPPTRDDPGPPSNPGPTPFKGRWLPNVMPFWKVYWVPQWWVLSVTALPPLLWCGLRLRSGRVKRRIRGMALCIGCGYDLRATPDRCPECGAAAPPANGAGASLGAPIDGA